MKKIWYLDIRGKLEGPYSVKDLKRDIRLTPDTLVWKEGFAHAVPIRNVPELKSVFTDDEPVPLEEPKKKIEGKQQNDLLLMEMSHEPPFLIWALIILTLFIVAWILSNN